MDGQQGHGEQAAHFRHFTFKDYMTWRRPDLGNNSHRDLGTETVIEAQGV